MLSVGMKYSVRDLLGYPIT